MRICLDPGHGGPDLGGGTLPGFIVEKDWCLDVAMRAARLLDLSGWFEPVVFTRDDDIDPSFRTRANMSHGSDVLVSLHLNNSKKNLSGVSTFHATGAGRPLAEALIRCSPTSLYRTRAPHLTSPTDWTSRAHNVLHRHRPVSVLYEAGFVSNVDDRYFLKSENGMNACATTVFAALVSYKTTWRAPGCF